LSDGKKTEFNERGKNTLYNKNKGFTLIEVTIAIAIFSIIGFSIMKYFKNMFDIWFTINDQVKVQREARTAMDEMSRFIRQSTNPVTGIIPAVGAVSTSQISFTYADTTGNKAMVYKRLGDALYREADGHSSAIITKGLEDVYFAHTSSYVVVIGSMTVNSGKGSIILDKTIALRNK